MAEKIKLELTKAEAGYVLDALSGMANHMPDPDFEEPEFPLTDEDRQAHAVVSNLRMRLQDAYHARPTVPPPL